MRTRIRLHVALAVTLATGAIACVYPAIFLVDLGANPAAGEGSLGYVGFAVAGLGAGFIAIVLALLALWAGLRARDLRSTAAE